MEEVDSSSPLQGYLGKLSLHSATSTTSSSSFSTCNILFVSDNAIIPSEELLNQVAIESTQLSDVSSHCICGTSFHSMLGSSDEWSFGVEDDEEFEEFDEDEIDTHLHKANQALLEKAREVSRLLAPRRHTYPSDEQAKTEGDMPCRWDARNNDTRKSVDSPIIPCRRSSDSAKDKSRSQYDSSSTRTRRISAKDMPEWLRRLPATDTVSGSRSARI